MPKVSKESASQINDNPIVDDRFEDVDGYRIEFVSIRQGHDLAPLLKGLPDDRCPCPHWGYVFKGKLIWRFADHEEVHEAGDAFYVPAGHAPEAEEGSEFVIFSPSEPAQKVDEVIARNAQEMQSA